MKIINTPPPNYEEIRKYFPDADFGKGVLFTYGDTCYCKSITPDLVVHEETHTRQQTNPKEWWDKYFIDPVFRFEQEVEAYHNQYNWVLTQTKDRNRIFNFLNGIARDLSGPLYGNCVSYSEALRRIKHG